MEATGNMWKYVIDINFDNERKQWSLQVIR